MINILLYLAVGQVLAEHQMVCEDEPVHSGKPISIKYLQTFWAQTSLDLNLNNIDYYLH